MEHDDPAALARAERFRRRRLTLERDLVALLGPRHAVAPIDDEATASRLHAEARASERAVEGQDWAQVRYAWPVADADEMVDTLHRIANNLGAREAWLIIPEREPQAIALGADVALDNPLGFASLDRGQLLLSDHALPAGLWLGLHPLDADGEPEYEWELVVWGEPWTSAATRALRGIG